VWNIPQYYFLTKKTPKNLNFSPAMEAMSENEGSSSIKNVAVVPRMLFWCGFLSLIPMVLPSRQFQTFRFQDAIADQRQLQQEEQTNLSIPIVDDEDRAAAPIVLQIMTNSPSILNRTVTMDPMVPFLEMQQQQRRALQDTLLEESKAWRIGEEPLFVRTIAIACCCLQYMTTITHSPPNSIACMLYLRNTWTINSR
jgi:hypothetical protein